VKPNLRKSTFRDEVGRDFNLQGDSDQVVRVACGTQQFSEMIANPRLFEASSINMCERMDDAYPALLG
jgi:hypothetical protein